MEKYDATFVKVARGDGIRRLDDPYFAVGHRECMKTLLRDTVEKYPAMEPFLRCSSIRTAAPGRPTCQGCELPLSPVQ